MGMAMAGKTGFELYPSHGEFGWRFKYFGRILAIGHQMFPKYRIRNAVKRAIALGAKAKLFKGCFTERCPYLIVFEDKAGKWRWHLKGGNRAIVLTGTKGYKLREDAVDAMISFKNAMKRGKRICID